MVLAVLVAVVPALPPASSQDTTVFAEVYSLSLPEARAFAPGLDGNGRTYLLGGETTGGAGLASILRFEGNQKRATTAAQVLPGARAGASAAFTEYGNQGPVAAYVAGGADRGQYTAEILRFELATEKITVAQGRLPSPRAFAATMGWGDQMIILGGDSPAGMLTEIINYKGSTGEVTTQPVTLPTPLAGAAAMNAGSQELYLFGGYAGSGGTVPTKGILRYDPGSNSVITMAATLPTPRAHMAAAWNQNEGRIIVAGGSATSGGVTTYFDDVLSYDPATDTIETLPVNLPTPRAGMYATWYGNVLYLIGGADANGPTKEIVRIGGFDWNFALDEKRVEIRAGESKLVSGTITSRSYSGNINFGLNARPCCLPFNGLNVNVGSGQTTRFFIEVSVAGDAFGTINVTLGASDNRGTQLETTFDVVVAGGANDFAGKLPSPREGSAAAFGGNGRFYVFGGRENTLDEIVEYDPTTDSSEIVARLPVALARLSAVSADGIVDGQRKCAAAGCPVYVFGGWSHDHNGRNFIFSFDPAQRTVDARTSLPNAVANAAVAWVPELGQAFIIGGADRDWGTRYDQIVRYDPNKNEAQTMGAKLPRPLSDLTAVAYGGKVFIFGGETADGFSADILEYDPISDRITPRSSTLPTAIAAMTGTAVGDRLFLLGGSVGGGGPRSAQILRYDPATDTLESLDLVLAEPLGWATSSSDPSTGNTFVFGGLRTDDTRTDGIMKLDGEALLGSRGALVTKADWGFTLAEEEITLGPGELKSVKASVAANNFSGVVGLSARWPEGIDVRPGGTELTLSRGATEELYFNIENFGIPDGPYTLTFRAEAERGGPQERELFVIVSGGVVDERDAEKRAAGTAEEPPTIDPGLAFSESGTLPSPRDHAAAVRWDANSIYFIGGSSSGNEILSFDTGTREVKVAARLPEPLVAAGAVLYTPPGQGGRCEVGAGCTILIIGGVGDGGPSEKIYSWAPGDSDVVRRTVDLPVGRSHFAAVYHEPTGRVYILGGRAGGPTTSIVLIYDPASETISDGTPLPHAGFDQAAVIIDDKILILGGRDGGASDEIIEYDVRTNSVSVRSARLPSPTWGSAAFVADGQVYVLGGAAEGTGSSVTRYDPGQDKATLLDVKLPGGLSGAAMAYDPGANQLYLAGGNLEGGAETATILSVDVATLTEAKVQEEDILGELLGPVIAVTLAGGIGYVATNPKMRARIGALTTRVFRPSAGFPQRGGGPIRYVIERELGKGGAGAAYLARDELLGRKVVIKKIFSKGLGAEAREMLLREARSASMVTHANLVTIYDVTQLDGQDVLVMEYVPGGSLEDLVKRGRLEESVAILMATRILRGLGALHRAGIVHRDMKPANILLTSELMPKISDMGIARAPGEAHLSMPGVQPGTLLYMSPEQARGEEIDHRSDLYSVAAVIYELLSGRFYLGDVEKNEYALRKAIVEAPPLLPLTHVREGVNPILEKALAKRREDRYQSADEFKSALESLADWDPGKTATN